MDQKQESCLLCTIQGKIGEILPLVEKRKLGGQRIRRLNFSEKSELTINPEKMGAPAL